MDRITNVEVLERISVGKLPWKNIVGRGNQWTKQCYETRSIVKTDCRWESRRKKL